MNYIRPVDGSSGEDTNCIHYGDPKIFNCWVVEFSMKIDTSKKLVNGMSFEEAMGEGKDFHFSVLNKRPQTVIISRFM